MEKKLSATLGLVRLTLSLRSVWSSSLRLVLITELDLAHVHAAPAKAPYLFLKSLFLLRILFWAGRQSALAAQKRI